MLRDKSNAVVKSIDKDWSCLWLQKVSPVGKIMDKNNIIEVDVFVGLAISGISLMKAKSFEDGTFVVGFVYLRSRKERPTLLR